MEIVVVEVDLEEGSTVVTGIVCAGVSPLASDGLDEAFGLAIGLRSVGTSEAMLEAQFEASMSKEL